MKVNFILPGLGDSGGMRVVKKYAKLFNEMGIDTVVYSPFFAYNLHRYRNRFINLLHQSYCTVKTFFYFIKTKDVQWVPYIKDRYIRKADHTIATMWATAYDVAILSDKCGIKWQFVQGYEIWDNSELGIKSYKLPLKKIVISTWLNNQLKQNIGIGPFPIVYNGIDTTFFCPQKDIHNNNHKFTIAMMNHSNVVKGVENGLEVIRRIKEKFPEVRVIMFGMTNGRNLPSYVEYYRNPSKKLLVELYQRTDVYLFPSLEEGWGLTPIEAMACGCAVVGTRTGFVLDIGKNRENMMISEPSDIDCLEKSVIELLENELLLEKIKKQGCLDVKKFEWKESALSFISYLKGK